MKRSFYILLLFSFALFSCGDEIRTDLQDQLLIESYIHFGQEENRISIRLFSPLSTIQEAPFYSPSTTRILNLSKGISTFPEFDTTGRYIINSTELNIEEGDNLQLQIDYEDIEVLAEAIIPSKPEIVELSEENLKINYIVDAIPERISCRWTTEMENFFIVRIDTASFDPIEINERRINEDVGNPYANRIGFPIAENEVDISFPSVKYFGRHRLILYHISKDYYDLYYNPVQGSYNKVNQSVLNALGIFTAMNSDTIYFNVIP